MKDRDRKLKALEQATQRVTAANRAHFDAMVAAFPLGALCSYRHGGSWVRVEVIEHTRSYGDSYCRTRVRSHTGKSYWIYSYRLVA